MEVEEPSSTSSSAPTAALPTSNNKDEKTADKPAAAAVAAAGGGAGELPTAAAILVAALPEVEVYLSTLVLTTLLRHGATANAVRVAPALLERAVSFNRRCARVRVCVCGVWRCGDVGLSRCTGN